LDAEEKNGLGNWRSGSHLPSPANGWFYRVTPSAGPNRTCADSVSTSLLISGHGPVWQWCWERGAKRGGTLRSTVSPSTSLWSWVKSCPDRKNWEHWPKFSLLGLLHHPPLSPPRILSTCIPDVRAIPPPIVDGMPCFRSVIRAASGWCGTTALFSRAQRPNPQQHTHPTLLSRDRLPSASAPQHHVAIVSASGRGRPVAGCWTCNRSCILFQKSSRAATVATPKGAHLTIGCYDHQERTRLRGAYRRG
jgi:hypothetical protein